MTDPAARAAAPQVASADAGQDGQPALVSQCPRCGGAVHSAASDFCEHCAAHLYPGHCVFCLEAFAPGQAFCRRCGLPPEGVTCGACGTFSRFDFCPNPDCGAGLTPRAAEEMQKLEHDTEAVAVFAELDAIGDVLAELEAMPETVAADPVPDDAPTVVALEATPAAVDASAAAAASDAGVAADAPPAGRPTLAQMREAMKKARSGAEKAAVRRLAEQASSAALNSIASRTFPTAQQARAAGTALQVALRFREVNERLEVVAWKCNAFNCEHAMPGGMTSCADPSQGGTPVTRVIRMERNESAEFSV